MAKRVILHPHACSPENPAVVTAVIEFVDAAFPGDTNCQVHWLFANANGYVAKVTQGSLERVLKLGRSSYDPRRPVIRPTGLAPSLSAAVMSSYQHRYIEYPEDYIAIEFSLMPYYTGQNYRSVIKQDKSSLNLAQRLRMGLEAIFAVQQLHAAGFVHLDLKPENIIWNPDLHESVLIDFDTSEQLSRLVTFKLNPADPVRGTVPYLAPEAVEHRQYNYASDVYAMSVILCDDLKLVPVELLQSAKETTSRRSSSLPAQWTLKTTTANELPKLSSAQQVLWSGLSYNDSDRPELDRLADAIVSIARDKLNPNQFQTLQVRFNEMRGLLALLSLHSAELNKDGGKTRLHLPLDLSYAEKCDLLAKHAFSSTNRFFKLSFTQNRTLRVMRQVGWLDGMHVTDHAPRAFQQAWRLVTNPEASSSDVHQGRAGANGTRLAHPLDCN